MITEEMIDEEGARIAEAIGKRYQNNEMSAIDLGNRLGFLAQYAKLTKKCLTNMQKLETGL